jgi:hypothetical protein
MAGLISDIKNIIMGYLPSPLYNGYEKCILLQSIAVESFNERGFRARVRELDHTLKYQPIPRRLSLQTVVNYHHVIDEIFYR